MNSPLRVGVVGVGYLGSIHAGIYARMSGVHLAGVADIEAETASKIGTRHACPYYTDPYALIDDVDAVSIVVPTSSHCEVALPYLDAGKHMLMEKPVAPTAEDAEKLVAKAEEAGNVFLVGHLERFNAGIMALAERVGDPRFIEVHRLGMFVERATDVDVVTDLMIHDIDIVLSLVHSDLKYVSAIGSPVVTNHVDIANARLEFENGAVANVTASRVSAKKFRRIRVFSGDGYHALNFIDQQMDIVRKTKPEPGQLYPGLVSEKLEVASKPSLDAELEHFVSIISSKQKPFVNGQDGIRALRVAELVQNKIKECLT
ncbi:MAG: Myo-inositol 2-dehydrogenase [Gammaproteobacteria bacterium]|nr:Myo-inositol 2-dehydrogenase [Gammaproteobacteria bacterium]